MNLQEEDVEKLYSLLFRYFPRISNYSDFAHEFKYKIQVKLFEFLLIHYHPDDVVNNILRFTCKVQITAFYILFWKLQDKQAAIESALLINRDGQLLALNFFLKHGMEAEDAMGKAPLFDSNSNSGSLKLLLEHGMPLKEAIENALKFKKSCQKRLLDTFLNYIKIDVKSAIKQALKFQSSTHEFIFISIYFVDAEPRMSLEEIIDKSAALGMSLEESIDKSLEFKNHKQVKELLILLDKGTDPRDAVATVLRNCEHSKKECGDSNEGDFIYDDDGRMITTTEALKFQSSIHKTVFRNIYIKGYEFRMPLEEAINKSLKFKNDAQVEELLRYLEEGDSPREAVDYILGEWEHSEQEDKDSNKGDVVTYDISSNSNDDDDDERGSSAVKLNNGSSNTSPSKTTETQNNDDGSGSRGSRKDGGDSNNHDNSSDAATISVSIAKETAIDNATFIGSFAELEKPVAIGALSTLLEVAVS